LREVVVPPPSYWGAFDSPCRKLPGKLPSRGRRGGVWVAVLLDLLRQRRPSAPVAEVMRLSTLFSNSHTRRGPPGVLPLPWVPPHSQSGGSNAPHPPPLSPPLSPFPSFPLSPLSPLSLLPPARPHYAHSTPAPPTPPDPDPDPKPSPLSPPLLSLLVCTFSDNFGCESI